MFPVVPPFLHRHFCSLLAMGLASAGLSSDGAELRRPVAPVVAKVAAPVRPVPKTFRSKPGPWGQLEYAYIYLEAPEHLLANFPIPNTIPRWNFEGSTEAQVRALFDRARLSTEFQARLFDPQRMLVQEGALVLFPAMADLEAMSAEARAIIYRELGKSDLNPYHKDPVFIACGDVGQWLERTNVRPEIQAKIQKLCYNRGSALAFSDLSALLSYANSDSEARQLFKVCTRTRTLIARLKVSDTKDVPALVEYWSNGYRTKDMLPMFQSIAETDGIDEIDISHLLPPFARKLIYTFPPMELAAEGRLPDCHWTSLNFFNYSPRELYLDTRFATSNVLENYSKATGDLRLGDVLMFVDDQTGGALHSCVYIADDLVFTKNGGNILTPWALMSLDDLKQIYLTNVAGHVVPYRRNAANLSTAH